MIRLRTLIGAPLALILLAAAAQPVRPSQSIKAADYDFSFAYPPRVAAVPALATYLDARRAAALSETAKDAAEERRDSRQNKYSFNRYETSIKWSMVTETPRLLSLSSETYTFSGGAHGGTSSSALVWDKTARQRLRPIDLFASPAALWAAIKPAYCNALNVERQKRRGEPVAAGSTDMFDTCPPFKDLTLLLGSTDRAAVNRIGLIADQYVAGSYAEGPYEVTLPVTAAVVTAVKPGYRAAFAVAQPAKR